MKQGIVEGKVERVSLYSDKPVTPPIIELCIHDYHQVSTDPKPPAEASGHHQQLDGSRGEQLLHNFALQIRQSFVKICNTIGQRLNESLCKNRRDGGVIRDQGWRGLKEEGQREDEKKKT